MTLRSLLPYLGDDPTIAMVSADAAPVVAVSEQARAFVLAGLSESLSRSPVLVVAPTHGEAERLVHDLRAYLAPEEVKLFPAWETLPFERVSPSVHTMGVRSRVLHRVSEHDETLRVIVAPVKALAQRLSDLDTLPESIRIAKGTEVELEDLVARLVHLGYRREYQVEHRGEIAVRGSIVDIYPSTADVPVRVDLWGDEVDRLSEFSPADQRSTHELDSVTIYAARELLPSDAVTARAEKLIETEAWGRANWEKLANSLVFDGMESWLPWLVEADAVLPDLLGAEAQIVLVEPRRIRDRASEVLGEEAALAEAIAQTWGVKIGAGEGESVDERVPRLHVAFERVLERTEAPTLSLVPVADSPDTPVFRSTGWGGGAGADGETLVHRVGKLSRSGTRVVVCADGAGSAARMSQSFADLGFAIAVVDELPILGRPRTLLIDSEQLESGDALDDNFRGMAADEIERFRREIVERSGDAQAGQNITDQDLLREVMNTVGKPGRLGDSIRCVVSVSMLTEGWDTNTVTHVLGVRAFGTQLLCEQVIGRALRRQSYDLNEEGLFNVEYADVLGIPFDFNAKPVVSPPQKPRETIQVKAVRPDRDALEIRFPRVQGYRAELPEERLTAEFNDDSTLDLTPDLVGATETRNSGIIGEAVDLNLVHTGDVRPSQVVYELTSHLVLSKFRDANGDPQLHLFGQLKRIARQWLDGYLRCKGGTYPAQLKYKMLGRHGLREDHGGHHPCADRLTPHQGRAGPVQPGGQHGARQLQHVQDRRWETSSQHCHVNWVILDSDWEAEFCRVAEKHPRVKAYVKNHSLGLEVPYRYGSETRQYRPDFIVLVDDGHGPDDLLHLIVEIKGYRREDAKEKKSTMDTYWVPGVNHLGSHGRWAFAEFTEVWQMQADFAKKVEAEFNKMMEVAAPATPAAALSN